jgi:purine-cytosine permease-like protein
MNKKTIIAVFCLLVMPLVTFAVSASDPSNKCRVTAGHETVCDGNDGEAVFIGIFAAVGWPLYWAWTAADYVRDQ